MRALLPVFTITLAGFTQLAEADKLLVLSKAKSELAIIDPDSLKLEKTVPVGHAPHVGGGHEAGHGLLLVGEPGHRRRIEPVVVGVHAARPHRRRDRVVAHAHRAARHGRWDGTSAGARKG